MLRGIVKWSFVAIGIALLIGLLVLAEAHWEMRGIAPPLPSRVEIDRALLEGEAPVRLRYVNTAEQRSAGSRIGHPAFLVEWADGRAMLIDTGMTEMGAVSFGKPFELVLRADPTIAYGSVRDQLGDSAGAIAAVAFTHLHVDHTGGLLPLCTGNEWRLTVFQTPLQAEKENFMTSGGREDLGLAACADFATLGSGPVYRIPGFPGVVAVAAGGHTPCTTVYFVKVGDVTWVLAGDIAFSHADIVANRPKPALYSYLLVPEWPDRLTELRQWLTGLESDAKHRVVVSHALDELEASGMERTGKSGVVH